MGLHIGDEVIGIIKASSILVSNEINIATSARNKIIGKISGIIFGEVNAQVSIDIGQNEIIVATITSESAKSLGLEIGSSVCAIIKSSSILIGK
jgi:molybdate transport system regulatory protein